MTNNKDALVRTINRETSVDFLRQWVFELSLICDEYEAGREKLKKEIADLCETIDDLRGDLRRAENRIDDYRSEVATLENRIDNLLS